MDTGFLMGEETQGHGTVEGAEEVAPHFYHPFMFLGPKVQLVVFCFDALVCKVADAVAKGVLVRPELPRNIQDFEVLSQSSISLLLIGGAHKRCS